MNDQVDSFQIIGNILDQTNQLMIEGRWDELNTMLSELDVVNISSLESMSWLRSCLPVRDKLSSYSGVLNKTKTYFIESGVNLRILQGLI